MYKEKQIVDCIMNYIIVLIDIGFYGQGMDEKTEVNCTIVTGARHGIHRTSEQL